MTPLAKLPCNQAHAVSTCFASSLRAQGRGTTDRKRVQHGRFLRSRGLCHRPATQAYSVTLCVLLVAGVPLWGCGVKGPPLAPLVVVPIPVTEQEIRRFGGEVRLGFTLPTRNQDGTEPADLARVDVYAMTTQPRLQPDRRLDLEEFEEAATLVASVEVRSQETPLAADPTGEAIDTQFGQGFPVDLTETLAAAAFVPVDPWEDERDDQDDEDDDETPESPVRFPLMTPQLPGPLQREYVVVSVSGRGHESEAPRVVVPLVAPPAPPPAPTLTYTETVIELVWELPPGARAAVQPPTTSTTGVGGSATAPAAPSVPSVPSTTTPADAASTTPRSAVQTPADATSTTTRSAAQTGTDTPVTIPADATSTTTRSAAQTGTDTPVTTPADATSTTTRSAAQTGTDPPVTTPADATSTTTRSAAQTGTDTPVTVPAPAGNTAAVQPATPPPPPAAPPPLRSTPIVEWPPASRYDLYELVQTQDEPAARPSPVRLNTVPLTTAAYTDRRVEFGVERCYAVSTLDVVGGLDLRSRLSTETCVTFVDTFPPAAPAGLVAVGSDGSVGLIWQPNDEDDLAGYLVLRGLSPGETLQPLTPAPVPENNYTDVSAEPGVLYVYGVRAVDSTTPSNISPLSNLDEATAR